MTGVYEILNIVDGKYYIGSSVDIENRFKAHIKELDNNTHNNQHLQNAWNKYGKECFEFNVLEIVPSDNLREREDYYIQMMSATNHDNGYNMLSTSNIGLGVSASDEVKAKISVACSGEKNGHYGKKHSIKTRERISAVKRQKSRQKWIDEKHICENCGIIMTVRYNRSGRFCSEKCMLEHKSKMQSAKTKGVAKPEGFGEKVSKSLIGKKFSEEHCKKISENAKNRMSDPTNNPMYGKKHSDETRQKISNSIREWHKHREVINYDNK